MTVETPFRDFLAFWAEAADRPPGEQVELWERLYAARHPELLGYYTAAIGGLDVEEALPRYPAVAGRMERTFAELDLEGAAAEVLGLFGTPRAVRAIAMVGSFKADAWVDAYQGGRAVFFALEAFDGVRVPRLSAVHEFAHVAHLHARDPGWDDDVPGLLLMMEAIALATTQRLLPAAPREHHYMVDDFAAWASTCDATWSHALDHLLGALEVRDERTMRRFFWPDWGRDQSDRDVPARIGYLVAGRLAELFLERETLPALACWPKQRALREVRAGLAALR